MAIKKKIKYYSLAPILSHGAHYNMIIGERSNGKTYGTLEYSLKEYFENGGEFVYLRRWQDDLKQKRLSTLFSPLEVNGVIEKMSEGRWTNIWYYAGRFYLCKYDEDGKRITAQEPCGYALAISSMEHDKSTSYPLVTTIVFDEFLSRAMYLPDEFVLFLNVVSTVIRYRNNVKIFMLGNTVNKYCPYFNEMGLRHIKNMKPGTIDVYTYGETELRVAVEYCGGSGQSKPSELYFAFDNPRLNMITGGAWELSIYPHCPVKYRPADVLFTYFIEFDGELLQCEIVGTDSGTFTFIHRKTTPIKNPDSDLIFSTEYSHKPNMRMTLTKPTLPIEKKLLSFFHANKVFYQDNDVGELVRNYLMWSIQFSATAHKQ